MASKPYKINVTIKKFIILFYVLYCIVGCESCRFRRVVGEGVMIE